MQGQGFCTCVISSVIVAWFLRLIKESSVAQTGPTGRDQSSVWGWRISIRIYVLKVQRIENIPISRMEYFIWVYVDVQYMTARGDVSFLGPR